MWSNCHIYYVHVLPYLKQNKICYGKLPFTLFLPPFTLRLSVYITQYSIWSKEKAKTSSPVFFPGSLVVHHILMQIYWWIFKCQVKHDWTSKIINLWGKSILTWKSGSHSYYFSILEHSSDLKNFFFFERKDEWAYITLGRILQKL